MLKRRSTDILASFDHPHTTGGSAEAINGRLEHLRRSAAGFRNLTNYITCCILDPMHPTTPDERPPNSITATRKLLTPYDTANITHNDRPTHTDRAFHNNA